MTMPASGQVSLSQAVTELGYASNTITMNDTMVRNLANKVTSNTQIAFTDFYNRYYTVFGQQNYTSVGSFSWTAPSGVKAVHVVAIGGGGGGYHSGAGVQEVAVVALVGRIILL